MTAEIKNQDTVRTPWVQRKATYFVIGGLLGVAAIFGWITDDQIDTWLGVVERTIPTLGAVALLFAGTKTKHGSDDDVTQQDLKEAVAMAGATSVASSTRDVLERMNEKLDSLSSSYAPEYSSEPVEEGSFGGAGTYPTGS